MTSNTWRHDDYLLLLEDNPGDARKAQRHLITSQPDLTVVTTSCLRDCLHQLHKSTPVAVIADLNLPDSNGIDTIKQIRAADPIIPIVVLTVIGFEELGSKAVDAGADDYLPKADLSAAALQRILKLSIHRGRRQQQLQEQVTTDPLTGVGSRHHLTTLADDLDTTSATVIFLDVDDFKIINDTYGHAAGDRVLQAVADRLTSAVRGSDHVVRYGGDEFVVILPQSPNPRDAIHRLRQAITDPTITSARGVEAAVNVSIGTAQKATDESLTDAIARADHAMYAAKPHGNVTTQSKLSVRGADR